MCTSTYVCALLLYVLCANEHVGAMCVQDGYAVVSSDGAGVFPVIETITAGRDPHSQLRAGQVAYVTTGRSLHVTSLISALA